MVLKHPEATGTGRESGPHLVDENIQYIAERELEQAMHERKPFRGTVVGGESAHPAKFWRWPPAQRQSNLPQGNYASAMK